MPKKVEINVTVLTGPQVLVASCVQPPPSSKSTSVDFAELQPSVATSGPTSFAPSSQYSVYQRPTAYQFYTG